MVHLRVDILDAEGGPVRASFQVGDYPFDSILLVGLGQDRLCREMKLEELLRKVGGSRLSAEDK